jgi:hypothetical protein
VLGYAAVQNIDNILFKCFVCLMMQASAGVTSPGKFVDSPSDGQSPDSMSVSGTDGTLLRLPAYSEGAVSIKLAQRGRFEITAQSLFPKIDDRSAINRLLPRFAIRVLESGQTVYQRRYSANETSLPEALAAAVRWIGDHSRGPLDWRSQPQAKVEIHLLLAAFISLDVCDRRWMAF